MAFRVMILVLCINFAIGIFQFTGGADNWLIEGSSNFTNNGQAQVGQLEALYNTSTTASIDQTSVVWYRSILDLISVGFFGKIIGFIKSVLFGIPTLFVDIGLIEPGYVYYLDGLLTLLYFLGMWELWTGRDLTFR